MVMVLRTRQISRWCNQLFQVSLFSLTTAMYLQAGCTIAAPSAKLEDWRFYPEASQLEINLSAGTTPNYFYLAQPPRIVVDLPNTKLGYVSTQQNYSGAIQKIRVSQLKANVTRIVLDLAPGTVFTPNQVQLQPLSQQNTTRWVLRPFIANGVSSQPGNYPQPPVGYNNYPQPGNNLPPVGYNNYPQPGNYPQPPVGYNNYPQPVNYPQPPVGYNNYPQPGNYPPPGGYNNYPQTGNNLPPGGYNSQTPLVTVPPLNSSNPTQESGSVLPPPVFSNQPSNFNNLPPAVTVPGFSVETIPNYPANVPDSGVVEFGQPFPNSGR